MFINTFSKYTIVEERRRSKQKGFILLKFYKCSNGRYCLNSILLLHNEKNITLLTSVLFYIFKVTSSFMLLQQIERSLLFLKIKKILKEFSDSENPFSISDLYYSNLLRYQTML